MKITDETPPYYCPASPLRGITHIDAHCAGLETLTRGRSLFRGSSLVSWERDMPLLEDGVYMFSWSKLLKLFKGALPSMREAQGMFERCRLDADSVYHIADTLPSLMHRSEIGIGVAEDVDDETLKPAPEEMDSKNRDVVIDRPPHT